MNLHAVAVFFDRTPATDAYDSSVQFMCQTEPLEMYRTEGTRIKIREMSTGPAVTIPSRRAINIDGQVFLVSDVSKDHWEGTAIRHRYVIQGADHLVEPRTIPQLLNDEDGTQAWASVNYVKYSTDERDSSEYHSQYMITLGAEQVGDEWLVDDGTNLYLVRESYTDTAGLRRALANKLIDPVKTLTVTSRVFDPVTETWTGTSDTISAVVVRWQEHFEYLSQGSEKFERGDVQALVLSSVTLQPNDLVTLDSEDWKVLSTLDYTGYRSLHMRRA